MSRRTALMTFALAATLMLGGLLVAAATDSRDRAFSLQVPMNSAVASLAPGRELCQGPITATTPFVGLRLWANPARSLVVTLRAPGGVIARRAVRTEPTPSGALQVGLGSSIGTGTRFSVCVRNTATAEVALEGGTATPASGALRGGGPAGSNAIAIVFLRSRPPSLLSLLPAVFRRAALFKLGWVGPWTFWLLLVALLGTFPLAAMALTAALSADSAQEPPPPAQDG